MTKLQFDILNYCYENRKAEGHPLHEIVKAVGLDPCKNHNMYIMKLVHKGWLGANLKLTRFYLTIKGWDLVEIERNKRL